MGSPSSISELAGQGVSLTATGRAESADQDILVAGDFRIDLYSRPVTVRGHELRLTPEEFEKLICLIGPPERVITPYTRVSVRWGSDQVRQPDFLRVLGQLREKTCVPGRLLTLHPH